MMADQRKLEQTQTRGVYRRHTTDCKRRDCKCPYIVRWKSKGVSHKEFFPTYELARERKNLLGSGKTTRRPLSSKTIAEYYPDWIEAYSGRTARGLSESTRREYKISFRLHLLTDPIARVRLRDLAAPDVKDWFKRMEKRGASPSTIKRARIALRVMLADAAEDGDVSSNPAANVRYAPSEAVRRRHAKPGPKRLSAADIEAVLNAMPEEWRAFFLLLVQTGVRVSELLGLTWANIQLGDDAKITVVEQVYRGQRKQLKTDESESSVPLSGTMASWLAELRPEGVEPTAPVFATATGGTLNYANVYNRVLRPALRDAGIAVQTGTVTVLRRGKEVEEPVWDYRRVAFHAFRHACGSLLYAKGLRLQQVQAWLRHAQLTTTMNVYIHDADDGLGSADVWDDTFGDVRGHRGATGHPETAANDRPVVSRDSASESQISEQPARAANMRGHS
jgi:integrase